MVTGDAETRMRQVFVHATPAIGTLSMVSPVLCNAANVSYIASGTSVAER